MTQPPLIAGLFRNEPASGGPFEHRLQDLWQQNLGSGYNFTLLNISKDISGAAPGDLTIASYDALPHGAFSRNAHKVFPDREWLSFGGVITNLPCPGLDEALADHIFSEAAQWAKYLGMHSVTFDIGGLSEDSATPQSVYFYGEVIARLLHKTRYEGFHLWIKTPWTDRGWRLWNTLRTSIGDTAKSRLHVIVDLDGLAAGDAMWNARFQRWFGESLSAVAMPTALFNAGGNAGTAGAALPSPLQEVCRHFFRYPQIKWLVYGPCQQGQNYAQYRDHLDRIRAGHPFSEEELFLLPSTDFLQRPMQPLQDQLHSANYALFEKDPVKYAQYEKAIRQALIDRHGDGGSVTLMVLGAGRGPLVDAAIRAAAGLTCKLKIFVVEKNPPAVVTLEHRARDDWSGHDVTIVKTDMRD